MGRIQFYKVKETQRLKCIDGSYQLLHKYIKWFNPKYYIVTHFNDGGNLNITIKKS